VDDDMNLLSICMMCSGSHLYSCCR
jgi:hypothetical protein